MRLRRSLIAVSLAASIVGGLAAEEPQLRPTAVFSAVAGPANASAAPSAGAPVGSHREKHRIVLRNTEKSRTLQTFCLGSEGRLLALLAGSFVEGTDSAAGGEVRVLDGAGKEIATWSVGFTPQRIAAAPDGTVYVAGSGRLLQLSSEGKLAAEVASPHLQAVMGDKDALRKTAQEQRDDSIRQYQEVLDSFDEQIKTLTDLKEKEAAEKKNGEDKNKNGDDKAKAKAKNNSASESQEKSVAADEKPQSNPAPTSTAGEASTGVTLFGVNLFGSSANEPTPESQLKQLQQMRKAYQQMIDQQQKTPLEEVERGIASRLQRIHGLAVSHDAVYAATAMSKGYGYAVWRMNRDFSEPKQIVTGLSGCCGQIDVQARGDELFVAENSRHRVVRYDRNGKRLDSWGQRDREGVAGGFGGCCNPMNLCFAPDGSVITSESEGLLKRFTVDGKFVDLVGGTKVGGGCKNVAAALSPDGKRAYFYDQQGSQIILLERADSAEAPSAPGAKPVLFN